MLLKPAPAMALGAAKLKEGTDADKVPPVYIKTSTRPPSGMFVIEGDHSPFFSTPFVLFGLIIKAAMNNHKGSCI